MVNCSQFLDGYSEFRDGEMDDGRRAGFEEHARHCASCAAYDRVVGDGVKLLQRLPALQVSEDFMPRLQHRLMHVEDERALSRYDARTVGAVVLSVALVLTAAASAPLLRTTPGVPQLPPIAAHAPHPVEHMSGMFAAAPGLMPAAAPLLTWMPAPPRLDLRAVALLLLPAAPPEVVQTAARP